MIHLADLNITNTRVTDISALAKTKNLTMLNLTNNKMPSTALVQAAIPNLEKLWLKGTNANDETLLAISNMKKLRVLELRDTQITDQGLTYLIGGKINDLAVSGTSITDKGVESIGRLPLKKLAIWDTKISADGLAGLDKCQQLEMLTVGRTPLSQISLQTLSKLTALTELHLSHIHNLHDDDLRYISKLKLQKLYLDDCPLTDNAAKYVDSIKSLKYLNMNQTKIGDKFLGNIEDLKLLEQICLEDVNTTDVGIRSLVKLQKLKTIDLGSSSITDAGLESLSGLPNLETVRTRFCPNISRQGVVALKKKRPVSVIIGLD